MKLTKLGHGARTDLQKSAHHVQAIRGRLSAAPTIRSIGAKPAGVSLLHNNPGHGEQAAAQEHAVIE